MNKTQIPNSNPPYSEADHTINKSRFNLMWKIMILGLCLYAIFYLAESFILITYPYQISYPEGFVLNQARIISTGGSIYQSINDYPYLVATYGPVYPYLCAIFVKIFGVSFAPGRIITFLGVLMIVFLIYQIVKKETDKKIALVAALFFIASSYIYKCTPLYRVDILGLLLSLLGIYLVAKFKDDNRALLSIPLFLAALYTKQTFFAAPVATAIYLFLHSKKRSAVFIAFSLASYATIFLILNHFTRGEFFKHNFLYNANVFIFQQALKYYVWALQTHAVLIVFSLIFLLFLVHDKQKSIYGIYFVLSVLAAITVGKIGSNMNYFFELIAASCILTGFSLYRLRAEFNDEKTYSMVAAGALIIQLVLFLHMPYLTKPTPTKYDFDSAKKVSAIIQNTAGDIIAEDAGLLLVNRKPVSFQPFELTQLANQGLWDQSKFIADLETRRFPLVILSFDINCTVDAERLTPQMVEALRKNYFLNKVIGEYYIHAPISN